MFSLGFATTCLQWSALSLVLTSREKNYGRKKSFVVGHSPIPMKSEVRSQKTKYSRTGCLGKKEPGIPRLVALTMVVVLVPRMVDLCMCKIGTNPVRRQTLSKSVQSLVLNLGVPTQFNVEVSSGWTLRDVLKSKNSALGGLASHQANVRERTHATFFPLFKICKWYER